MVRDHGLATGLCGQPGIAEYMEKCRIPYKVISKGREQDRVSGAGNPPGDPAVKSEWGEMFRHSVGLNHDQLSLQDVLRFYDNMLGCSRELRKKWFRYFNPFAVVMSKQDLKDELGLGGELSMTGWRCIHGMISAKK